jgi:hypothetical protein
MTFGTNGCMMDIGLLDRDGHVCRRKKFFEAENIACRIKEKEMTDAK